MNCISILAKAKALILTAGQFFDNNNNDTIDEDVLLFSFFPQNDVNDDDDDAGDDDDFDDIQLLNIIKNKKRILTIYILASFSPNSFSQTFYDIAMHFFPLCWFP